MNVFKNNYQEMNKSSSKAHFGNKILERRDRDSCQR